MVAIDGKVLKGARQAGKALVHMVSTWVNSNNLVLGQRKVDDKSNEITAIPKLLQALELRQNQRRCVLLNTVQGRRSLLVASTEGHRLRYTPTLVLL